MEENQAFSPFDAPKKEVKSPGQTDNTGMKIEHITDNELDGKGKSDGGFSNSGTAPKDAPEFTIPNFDDVPNSTSVPGSSGGGNSGGGGNYPPNDGGKSDSKVDPGFAKEFSEYTAKWLVDLFFKLLIFGVHSYAKIDRSKVQQSIRSGEIDEKFLRFVDEANKNVEREITVSEEQKKFVIEPLKYYLEVKKIQVKPEYMFMGGLAMVTGQVIFSAIEVKKQNKELLDRMISESAKNRSRNTGGSAPSDNYEQSTTFSSSQPEPTYTVDDPNKSSDGTIHFGASDVEIVPDNT